MIASASGVPVADRRRAPPMNLLPLVTQIIVGHLLLRPFARFVFRARRLRSRTLPEGPCVYACNHRSFYDPPAIGMWSRYPLSYFARADLWKNPFIAFFLRIMYGIPIDRDNPGISSMKGAVERLRNGISVLVFPEGTRTKTGRLGRFREGPALFARRASVPVVPVYILRSDQVWPRGAKLPGISAKGVEVRFGSPIIAPAHLEPREQDAWISRRLQAWMELQERKLLGPPPNG